MSPCESTPGVPGRALLLLALAALLPVLPYAAVGYAGHDFNFHAASWFEVRSTWQAHHGYPAWAAHANFNHGDARFAFYPPVSFLLGGVLSMILPFQLVPGAFVWISVTLAGIAMYVAAGAFLPQRDRLWSALLYMLNPCLIATSLVRFAASELLAQAMLPLLILLVYDVLLGRDWRRVAWLGALLGLLWLTNIPVSIVLFYTLLCVAAAMAWQQRSAMPLLRVAIAEIGALLLAAFRLLPAWLDRGTIHYRSLVTIGPRAFLLFMPAGTAGPQPLKTLKWSLWLFACASVAMIAVAVWRRRTSAAMRLWLTFAAAAFFFETPLALPLWLHLPQLYFAEFPFRFLPLLFVVLPLVLLAPETRKGLRQPCAACLALLSIVPLFEHIRVQHNPATRTPPLLQLVGQWQKEGYRGVPEYVPEGQVWQIEPPPSESNAALSTSKP